MSKINEELSSADAAAVTKVMLSMHASYGEINAVREKMNKGDITAGLLLDIITKIARSTSLFNAFVAEYKKNESVNSIGVTLDEAAKMTNGVKWQLAPEKDRLRGEYYVTYDVRTKKMVAFGLTAKGAQAIADTDKENLKSASANHFADNIMKKGVNEEVLTEEDATKLVNDITSLKRIGWNLDRITKHLITSKEYGVTMTSDMIKNIFSPPKMGAPTKATKPSKGDKAPSGWGMRKNVKWPKDPPASRLNDPSHAEGWIGQAIDSGESPDITGSEMHELLRQAGYTPAVIARVIKNFGMEGDLHPGMAGYVPRTTPLAKKTARKTFESISNFKGALIEESVVKPLLGKSPEQLLKLHYSKFPSENDPELRTLSYNERSAIMKAKDAVIASSKDLIKKDKMKVGKGAFKISGAKVNDYTSLGQVTKISDSGVTFNGGKEVSFDSLIIGGESVFAKLAKMTKAEFDSQTKSKSAATASLMAAHAKATPRKLD